MCKPFKEKAIEPAHEACGVLWLASFSEQGLIEQQPHKVSEGV